MQKTPRCALVGAFFSDALDCWEIFSSLPVLHIFFFIAIEHCIRRLDLFDPVQVIGEFLDGALLFRTELLTQLVDPYLVQEDPVCFRVILAGVDEDFQKLWILSQLVVDANAQATAFLVYDLAFIGLSIQWLTAVVAIVIGIVFFGLLT